MTEGNGFTEEEMCKRFVHDMEQAWDNFKPRARMTIDNATLWNKSYPKSNGLTLNKEI